MEKDCQTITLELNREAVLHFLKFVGGAYSVEHREKDGVTYGVMKCPYCIALLTKLSTARDDVEIQENIRRMRLRARAKQKTYDDQTKKSAHR